MNREALDSLDKDALIRLGLAGADDFGIEAANGARRMPGRDLPLHQNPAHKREAMASSCQHCGADVSSVAQTACENYDRVEIPDIKPDVARVTLHGGVCSCCAHRP